jgi:hypothetical protein
MKALEQFMRIIERGISGAFALVAIAIVSMGFISTSQFRSTSVDPPEGPVELVRPMSDPTMAKAYRVLSKNGMVKGSETTLSDSEKHRLNQTYRGWKKAIADRARQSSFSSSSDSDYNAPSDGWGY